LLYKPPSPEGKQREKWREYSLNGKPGTALLGNRGRGEKGRKCVKGTVDWTVYMRNEPRKKRGRGEAD